MGKPKFYNYQVLEHKITKELYIVLSSNVPLKGYPLTVRKLADINKPMTPNMVVKELWHYPARIKREYKILSKAKSAHITKSVKVLYGKSN